MRIAIFNTSVPYHAENFYRNLKAAGYDVTFIACPPETQKIDWGEFDVLWSVGNFLQTNIDIFYDIVKRKNRAIKIVGHWVGTDLLQLQQFTTFRKKCVDCVLQDIDLNVTDNQFFIKEFYELTGQDCEYVTLIPEKPLELRPLPEKFAVACYVPNERLEFYRFITVSDLAAKLPDVEFYFLRTEGKSPMANCHYLGWVKGQQKLDLYEKCSVALSIPVHGSLGVWVIELMQMGRRAITSEPHPYCVLAEKPEQIMSTLVEMKDKASPDDEASTYYRVEYSPKHQVELVDKALKKLMEER